jgi:hypothetical protein
MTDTTGSQPRLGDETVHQRLPEHDLMNSLIGKWMTVGQTISTDGEPALDIHASDIYEWVAGRFFLLHTAYGRIGDAGAWTVSTSWCCRSPPRASRPGRSPRTWPRCTARRWRGTRSPTRATARTTARPINALGPTRHLTPLGTGHLGDGKAVVEEGAGGGVSGLFGGVAEDDGHDAAAIAVAEAAMHQPASSVWPVVMPSAPR